ncbi:MAG: heavy-metal-associated domain-containing protein [Comamonas sp.]
MSQIFHVQGMTCGHCEKAVAKAIHRLDPEAQVQVSRSAERVEVAGTQQTRQALAQAIRDEGYAVQDAE